MFFVKGSERLLEHLKTGCPIELPAEFFNVVLTLTTPSDEKYVIAVAHALNDPDEIAEQFRNRVIEIFGEKSKVDDEDLETAEYFVMKEKARGSLEPIVEIYLKRHPDEMPYAEGTEEYNVEKEKIKDKLKHRINRRFPGKENSRETGDKK